MIDLYTWSTPNGHKVSIMLEECGVDYAVHPVNIREQEQFSKEFVAICPNSKIPAIVDQDGPDGPLSLFESGAILIYLAEKTDQFMPRDVRGRAKVMEWLMFQMANIGPMMGQAGHFMNSAPEQIPYAIERYVGETVRLLKVMDAHLDAHEYLAGEYSIADMANFAWVRLGLPLLGDQLDDAPAKGQNIRRWVDVIATRPAVEKGILIPQID